LNIIFVAVQFISSSRRLVYSSRSHQ